ncbi:DUF4352 domain-containing protein [Rossellomorea sp. BNER]|uniref:DUF4352 domain-containing protein n=1 Tax=Rossellomorea sp. BNER TaxID=2962031 RepID=UPI003AF2983C|nr:DUF4352 domain-containing protein [Rossellomorea sp. BNER]
MKKILLGIGLSTLLLLAACGTEDASSGDNSSDNKKTEEKKSKGVVALEDFDKMYSDPTAYKGHSVEFTGKIFAEPEKDSDGTYIQVFAKPENSEQNIIVGIKDPDFKVQMDDYVKVNGIVKDTFEGENLMGGTIDAPVIEADSIEVVDYITAVSPTIKTIEVNQELEQHGYVVQVQKIELAENQTRVYLKVLNNSDTPISFYAHDAKLIVGNKQLEEEYLYETGLPEIQSDILAGVESEGVITYPAIDPNTKTIKFHAEGYSENYDITIEPFTFDITAE